jgi:hypothetical protein
MRYMLRRLGYGVNVNNQHWANDPLNPLWVKANHAFYHAWDSVTVYSISTWTARGQGSPLCGNNQPVDHLGLLWVESGPPEGDEANRCEACVNELVLRGFTK